MFFPTPTPDDIRRLRPQLHRGGADVLPRSVPRPGEPFFARAVPRRVHGLRRRNRGNEPAPDGAGAAENDALPNTVPTARMSDEFARSSALVAGAGGSLLRKIWRRRTLFVLVFGAVLAASLIALLVLPVRFMATGSVIVAEQEPGVQSASPGWAEKIGDPADLESQLLVIRSPRVLRCRDDAPRRARRCAQGVPLQTRRRVRLPLVPQLASSCDKLKPDSEALLDYLQAGYRSGRWDARASSTFPICRRCPRARSSWPMP